MKMVHETRHHLLQLSAPPLLADTNNSDAGVRVLGAALRDATLIGNNGYGLGFDILTTRRPRVSNVTCGTSGVLGGFTTDTWGVCAGD